MDRRTDGWMDGWMMSRWMVVVGGWIPQEQGSYSQCEEPSDSKVSQMREVAIGDGRQGQGDPKREGSCHQIQCQGFRYLGTNGMQPGMAPGGQGEVGLPSKGVHHLNRGASGKGGSPLGYPSLLPPPHEEEAPTCSTNFPWRWRLCGGAPGWEEMGHPPRPLMSGGRFWLGVRGCCCLISLSCGFPRPLGLLSPPRWG